MTEWHRFINDRQAYLGQVQHVAVHIDDMGKKSNNFIFVRELFCQQLFILVNVCFEIGFV